MLETLRNSCKLPAALICVCCFTLGAGRRWADGSLFAVASRYRLASPKEAARPGPFWMFHRCGS
eukprot:9914010-Alexandrium_andersonii.AAC.1